MKKKGGFDYEMFARYREHLNKGEEKQAKILRDRLVVANMPLVHKLVGKLHRRAHIAAELEDLVQAGAIGVMKALPRYVPGKGAFATYAAHWVRDEVQNCMLHQMRMYRPRGSGMPYQTFRKIEEYDHPHKSVRGKFHAPYSTAPRPSAAMEFRPAPAPPEAPGVKVG